MKWHIGLGILSVLLSGVLFGQLSDNAYAATIYDDVIQVETDQTIFHEDYNNGEPVSISDIFSIIRDADNATCNETTYNEIMSAIGNGGSYGISKFYNYDSYTSEVTSTHAVLQWSTDENLVADFTDFTNYRVLRSNIPSSPYKHQLMIYLNPSNGNFVCSPAYGNGGIIAGKIITDYHGVGNNGKPLAKPFYWKGSVDYPAEYGGLEIPQTVNSNSDWVPEIKLLQGSNWLVELSDYNFFTFDKVAFTCGENELVPIVNWEVWDITDENNPILIDTLTFGAAALVKYQAPKVQEDKKYEIVAYYSDCEGMTFNSESSKTFTVNKDGTLNKADYMTLCVREDFPYINITDCLAELNDFLVVLTFRVPNEDRLAGGVFKDIPNGCRELQVLDDWLFSPNQEICPQFSSETRQIITPFITFALGLMAVTFVARRQSIRSIN